MRVPVSAEDPDRFPVAQTATSPALSLDIEPSAALKGLPALPIHDARHTSSLAASISILMSAQCEGDRLVLDDRSAELSALL